MKIAIGLTFPGELKDDSVICYICKEYNINVNIIEASFSNVSGWAILEVEGEEAELKKVFEYLGSKNIKTRQIQKNNS